ncbi:MAG: MBL fold metallo-hydrolase, partial [Candidatus Bipolaricaulia bacterium]
EGPNYLILDGPSTYLLGYMLNRTNLNRAIANAKRITENLDPEVMIFDHHLLRDRRYRKRMATIWATSAKVVTAAEWLGQEPLLDLINTRSPSSP